MTILDELNDALRHCKCEMQQYENEKKTAELRISCCREKQELLEKLIETAKTEQKPAPAAANRKKPKPADDMNGITTKALAEKLNVPTTAIAQACTELGYELKMEDNKFTLTAEQANAIKKRLS